MSAVIDFAEDVSYATEYLLTDPECADTQDRIRAGGFNADALTFATIINGEDNVCYGMFVTPDQTVYEFEHDLDGGNMRIWQTQDLKDAAHRVPSLPAALAMVGIPTPA